MTSSTLISTGIILLAVVGVAYGGTFLLRVVSRGMLGAAILTGPDGSGALSACGAAARARAS